MRVVSRFPSRPRSLFGVGMGDDVVQVPLACNPQPETREVGGR